MPKKRELTDLSPPEQKNRSQEITLLSCVSVCLLVWKPSFSFYYIFGYCSLMAAQLSFPPNSTKMGWKRGVYFIIIISPLFFFFFKKEEKEEGNVVGSHFLSIHIVVGCIHVVDV